MGKRCKTQGLFTQQVSKLWILLPQDVMDLKGLKGLKLIEYINGRKNQRLLKTKVPSLVQTFPELQSQKAGSYIKRMSLHFCLFLYSSQSRQYLLLPETGSWAGWTLNLIQCICSCDLILTCSERKKKEERRDVSVLRAFKLWGLCVQPTDVSKKDLNLQNINWR